VFTGDLLAFQSCCCGLAAALRHVRGFPALGLLRRLRPRAGSSADDAPARRRTWLADGKGDPDGFPRSLDVDRSGRCPTLPLQHRHGYAADLLRGLRGAL